MTGNRLGVGWRKVCHGGAGGRDRKGAAKELEGDKYITYLVMKWTNSLKEKSYNNE